MTRKRLCSLLVVCLLLVAIPASPAGAARERPAGTTPINEQLDVEWGTSTSGKVLTADLRWPQGATTRLPVVVLVHGGARRGDKSKMAEVGVDLAELGYFTMATNYTLKTDKANYAEYAIQDLIDAIKWVAHRPEVNPRRMGMLGSSNAAMLVTVMGLGVAKLRAVVAWSGNAGNPPPDSSVHVPRWAALSTVDQSVTMESEQANQQAWINAGRPTQLYTTDGQCHGNCFWTYLDPDSGTMVARENAIAWLDRFLKT